VILLNAAMGRKVSTGVPNARCEKKVGFKEEDYKVWLKDTGRQHSISNLFHFLSWISNKLDSPVTAQG